MQSILAWQQNDKFKDCLKATNYKQKRPSLHSGYLLEQLSKPVGIEKLKDHLGLRDKQGIRGTFF